MSPRIREGRLSVVSGTEPRARVLVVDDQAYITDLVGTALRYEGFDVAVAASGREALIRAGEFRPDLLVLDVMLPDVDGIEVCARLRRDGMEAPVVFLTARDATEDKIAGLTVGGDDYVTKPFSLEELIARVRAVLRRTGPGHRPARLAFADLEIDEDVHEASRRGAPLDLRPTEYKLLRYLILNGGRVVSKAQILDHVWNYDFGGSDNVVETYVSYLRRKLDSHGPPLIHTVRGVGYVLRLPRS
jgi:two-component system OmpR family response regulator